MFVGECLVVTLVFLVLLPRLVIGKLRSQEEFNEEPLLPHQTTPPKSVLGMSKVPLVTSKSLVDKETSDVIVDSEATRVFSPPLFLPD